MKRLIIMLLIIAAGCGKEESKPFSTGSMRIISIAPANTEILFKLGLDKEIVAVTNYCNYPEQALLKEKVGDFSNPNIEKIISLKPSLIVGTGYEQLNTLKKLKALKIQVIEINPNNMLELYYGIRLIGKYTNRQKEAEKLVLSMQSRVNSIKKKVSAIKYKARIFMEINSKPLMTVSSGSFMDELINILGENSASGLPRAFCRISDEFLIQKNPDIIFLTSTIKKGDFMKQHSFNNVSAVKNGRVYDDINPDILVRPSPRIVDGLEAMFSRIYDEKK